MRGVFQIRDLQLLYVWHHISSPYKYLLHFMESQHTVKTVKKLIAVPELLLDPLTCSLRMDSTTIVCMNNTACFRWRGYVKLGFSLIHTCHPVISLMHTQADVGKLQLCGSICTEQVKVMLTVLQWLS